MNLLFAVFSLLYMLAIIMLANVLDKNSDAVKPARRFQLTYPYTVLEVAGTAPAQAVSTVEEAPRSLVNLYHLMIAGALGMWLLNALALLLTSLYPALLPTGEPLALPEGYIAAGVGVVSGIAAVAVVFSGRLRRWLAARVVGEGAFRASSFVHRTALLLAILVLSNTFMTVLQLGGVEGLAAEYAEQPIRQWDSLLNLGAMLVTAFLGVGLTVRRSLTEAIARLGLRLPTLDDVIWGFGTAFASLMMIFLFLFILNLFLPPELLENQGGASDQIARVLSQSLWIAFLAAASAAIGEEILFRGALQPIFGIIPTTLLFALLHSQYAFTPGSLAIILVGGAFAWLKEQQSTTSAIIAHFAYNFVLLGLAYVAFQMEEMGITPEALEGILFIVRGTVGSL